MLSFVTTVQVLLTLRLLLLPKVIPKEGLLYVCQFGPKTEFQVIVMEIYGVCCYTL